MTLLKILQLLRASFRFSLFLAALALLCTGCADVVYVQPSSRSYVTNASSLREAAQVNHLMYGVAVKTVEIANDPQFAQLVASQAGVIVPENELKWETTEPQPGQFNFGPADVLFSFAQQHGILFRGHNLVWHQQLPSWVASESGAQFQSDFAQHIQQEVAHYAGQIHSWDVVNEGIEPGDGRADGLRDSVFLKRLGPSYIDQAFQIAGATDPKAILVYNEAGLEYDNSDGDARRAAVLKLLTGMKQRGVPVHALGIEAHLAVAKIDEFNPDKLTAFIDSVSALGLRVFITELDVADNGLPADPTATRDQVVADCYFKFLKAALAHGKVDAVINWGLSDRYTWLSQWKPRGDGVPGRPLPFDENLDSTKAFGALAEALDPASGNDSN